MRKSFTVALTFIVSFIFIQSVKAQQPGPAIIKDPDGFVNIREHATTDSKILDTLSNGRLVYMLPEETLSNWIMVDYNKGQQSLSGYVHKSRVVFLKDLTVFNENIVRDTLIQLELNEMQITIISGKFVKAGRKIAYSKSEGEGQLLKTIDGKNPWGTDGYLPEKEYRSIKLKLGSQTLNFPKSQFNDLFHPSHHRTSASFDKATNKVYIYADNGDAAGSYSVIWIIKNGKIERREVFVPF